MRTSTRTKINGLFDKAAMPLTTREFNKKVETLSGKASPSLSSEDKSIWTYLSRAIIDSKSEDIKSTLARIQGLYIASKSNPNLAINSQERLKLKESVSQILGKDYKGGLLEATTILDFIDQIKVK